MDSPRGLPTFAAPRHLVFTDFDESYLAHDQTSQTRSDLIALEDFIRQHAELSKLLFGIVTGSSLNAVQGKLKERDLYFLPHFISTSLGTRLFYFDKDGREREDERYRSMLHDDQYGKKVTCVITKLGERIGQFEPQPSCHLDEYKTSYYYFSNGSSEDSSDLTMIERTAAAHGLTVNINKCNPLAGDPADAYDVDFLPRNAGKLAVARYLMKRFSVPEQRVWAFGDSGSDVPLLTGLPNGYCLANATQEARRFVAKVTEAPYAGGILEILERDLGAKPWITQNA